MDSQIQVNILNTQTLLAMQLIQKKITNHN